MWRSVGVLLWKNWRIKQRESRLNRGRTGGSWLFPALLTDIVLPLTLMLLFIRMVCQYNAQLVTPTTHNILGGDGAGALLKPERTFSMHRHLEWGDEDAAEVETVDVGANFMPFSHPTVRKPAALLLAALPLLLHKNNQSLAIIDRPETNQFVAYLDKCVSAVLLT